MKNRVKTGAALMTIMTGLCIAPFANAQDTYFSHFENKQNVSTTAGVHLTIPFGGKSSNRAVDKARFGLMLNMTREYNARNFYTPTREKTNLMDIGMQLDGRPTMLMAGEDIYMPLFEPDAYAQSNLAGVNPSKNAVLIIAGGTLAVGAAIALAGSGSNNNNDNNNNNNNDGPDNDNDGGN